MHQLSQRRTDGDNWQERQRRKTTHEALKFRVVAIRNRQAAGLRDVSVICLTEMEITQSMRCRRQNISDGDVHCRFAVGYNRGQLKLDADYRGVA